MSTNHEMPALTDEQRKDLLEEIDHNRKNCFLSSKTKLLMQVAEAALMAPPVASVLEHQDVELNWQGREMKAGDELYPAPPVPALKPIDLTYEQKRAIAHSAHFKCQQIRGTFYNAAEFAIEDVLRLSGVDK